MPLSQTIDSLPFLRNLVLTLPDTPPPFPGEALGFMFRLGRSHNAIESRGGFLKITGMTFSQLVGRRHAALASSPQIFSRLISFRFESFITTRNDST